jgi:hypothetical protein
MREWADIYPAGLQCYIVIPIPKNALKTIKNTSDQKDKSFAPTQDISIC